MDRNSIRKEIIALVGNIKNQSDILANEKYPSQLDLELFLHKIEKLYQKSIVFNHLSLFDGFEEQEQPEQHPEPAHPPILIAEAPVKKEALITEHIQELPVPPQPVKAEEPVVQPEPVPVINKPPVEKAAAPIAPAVQKKALPDLKSAMGINDKFQFTNELFKGNMQEFNIAIEQLNAADTLASALNYLKSMQPLYGWDEENETFKRLLNIVNRRYA
jgi:type IV secretory pathway VirB10-like protein